MDQITQNVSSRLLDYGVLGIIVLVALYAAWKVYNRMADRLDESANAHLKLISEQQQRMQEHAEECHKGLEAQTAKLTEVVSNNTTVMTRVCDAQDRIETAIGNLERTVLKG